MGRLSRRPVRRRRQSKRPSRTASPASSAMREAIGPDVELMVDCHSFFDVPLAERVARRLEPQKLAWYEEPVAPERIEETREIRRRIQQPMAAGEMLFGVAGFAPLCRNATVNVIMPDVKHCGGLLELTRIAAVAEAGRRRRGAAQSERSGFDGRERPGLRGAEEFPPARVPVGRGGVAIATSSSPPELFVKGSIARSRSSGFGIELNDKVVRAHPV